MRGRAGWKAPSLSFTFKIVALAYASTLSLRILSDLQWHSSLPSASIQQLLEEFSIAPRSSLSVKYKNSVTVNARLRSTRIQDYQRRRASLFSDTIANPADPLLIQCLCQHPSTTNDTTTGACNHNVSLTADHYSIIEILNRDLRRIPAYIPGCLHVTFYGYVFRDLVNRLFPKPLIPFNPNKHKISIIVSNDALRVSLDAVWNKNNDYIKDHQISSLQRRYAYNAAASIYTATRARGYPVHAMASPTSSSDSNDTKTVDNWWKKHSSKANGAEKNIWLALFDPQDIRQQDALVTNHSALFLREASIDYLVFRIVVSSNACHGKHAANHLLQAGYQLQILSASHTIPPKSTKSKSNRKNIVAPNQLIRTQEEVDAFFRYVQVYLTTQQRHQESKQGFVAYLFATKTIDMAIPNAQEYINLTGEETNDLVLNVDGDAIPYKTCRPSVATISWNRTTHEITANSTPIDSQSHFYFRCRYDRTPLNIWFSNAKPETSEVACVQCPDLSKVFRGDKRLEQTECTSRFLPQAVGEAHPSSTKSGKPNILVLFLEQLSRPGFEKFMARTKSALLTKNGKLGGFWEMKNYLATSIDPHHQSRILVTGEESSRPILSLLQQNGYEVLSAGNFCNASLLLNGQDSSFHGSQLNSMMCRQIPARPNCIGTMSTTDHLLQYANRFIDHYGHEKRRWAAFLSFVEGREETGILPGTIDGKLAAFVNQLRADMTKNEWDNTLIVVTSNTGLSHGSFAQSFAGQQQLVQPLLYLKAYNTRGTAALKHNQKRYATPNDVHRTLVEAIASGNRSSGTHSKDGISLLTPLADGRLNCRNVSGIPKSICDIVDSSISKSIGKKVSLESTLPPSILSFYADIPKDNRNHIHVNLTKGVPERAIVRPGCQCATNMDKWFPCDVHPWSNPSPAAFKEFFMLVDCPNQSTHLELNVVENRVVTKRAQSRLQSYSTDSKRLPNIIFLEVDSVSGAFADRHFPKTRELLKHYRVHRHHNGSYQCVDGVCSADLTEGISLAGANSIPNQVAALSGCISSDYDHRCGIKEEDMDNNLYCNDPSEPHYGLQIHRFRGGARQIYWCPAQPGARQRISPWLFSITDSLGYLNYFGEEFCYEGSPLAELRIQREKAEVPDDFRWGYEKQDQACIDSDADDCYFEKARISLELIEQMWEVYPNYPKFAFLNVLAAHVYNADWSKVFLAAERYDDHLSAFLERMISSDDFDNTVIVMRSDHGLQRGPSAMNYNLQVEHTQPWTEILVPEKFPSVSKQALFKNQYRLTSGFDLYHTLRSLMEIKNAPKVLPPLSNWSYDLLSTTVPAGRTCRDAKVDDDLCRQKSIIPSFGICNALDNRQKKFCRGYEVQAEVSPRDLPPGHTVSGLKMTGLTLNSNVTFNITKIKETLAMLKEVMSNESGSAK